MLSKYYKISITTGAINRLIVLTVRNIHESIRYYITRGNISKNKIKSVIFVCSGNICRSAFAESIYKKLASDKVLTIDSCGLNVESSSTPPDEAISTAKKFSVNIENHKSKGWKSCDLSHADIILAMEYWQYKELRKYFPQNKCNIRLLREYAPFPENLLCNIYDPFARSENEYEKCFNKINRALLRFNRLVFK